MATITQDMRYRLSLIKYAERFGVTKAAIKYKTNRQYIYRWKRRYDGSIESLRDRSRRPHHHPNQHTPEEIKLIFDMRRRNPNAGLVVFWVKLKQRGYSRSIPGLYRFLRKQGIMAVHPPNPKYIPKPYGIWVNKKSENDILILSDTCACRWHGRWHSRCRGKCPLKNKKVNSPLLCGIVAMLTKIQA